MRLCICNTEYYFIANFPCVFINVPMCVSVWLDVHTQTRGSQSSYSGVFLKCSSFRFLSQAFSLTLELTHCQNKLPHKSQRSIYLHHFSSTTKVTESSSYLYGFWESKLRSSCLNNKHFTVD